MIKINVSKILFILGIVPFLVVIFTSLYSAIMGFSGLSIGTPIYGIEALFDWFILYSYMFWYTYVIGILLIVVSFVLKKTDN